MFRHDEAAQRRAVVVALEAALHHLAEGDERQNLARRACGIRQRYVGEALDVDDLAGQQLDGRVVARDQREGFRARERRVQGGRARCHRRPFIGSGGSLEMRKTALGRSVVWEREHTAVSGRATTW